MDISTSSFNGLSPDQILNKAAKVFKQKNQEYGSAYENAGAVLQALFPKGVTLKTYEDFIRFHLLVLQVVKLTRYCNNIHSGHDDSLVDIAVHSAIMLSVDRK